MDAWWRRHPRRRNFNSATGFAEPPAVAGPDVEWEAEAMPALAGIATDPATAMPISTPRSTESKCSRGI
jgi:hypothetical protein